MVIDTAENTFGTLDHVAFTQPFPHIHCNPFIASQKLAYIHCHPSLLNSHYHTPIDTHPLPHAHCHSPTAICPLPHAHCHTPHCHTHFSVVTCIGTALMRMKVLKGSNYKNTPNHLEGIEYLGFEDITLVPIEAKLLMSAAEVNWLNYYHSQFQKKELPMVYELQYLP
ncbi:hypothetical protein MKW92_023328 [Papaver armeniacum]|nr:hypothetical protein MKW92_023328 [Papaver armeniacum]